MKNLVIGIIVALLLIGTIAGAGVLYNNLGEEYNKAKESIGGLEVFEGDEGLDVFDSFRGEDISASTIGNKEDAKEPHVTTSKSTTTESNGGDTTTAKLPATDVTTQGTVGTQLPEMDKTTITSSQVPPKVTLSVPDFEVLDYNGNRVKLSDFAGNPIVINFWATWCYYCKQEMSDFDKAYREHPDVVFLMVNATDGVSETVASAKKYIESEGYDFSVYFDTTEEALYAYDINSFPSTFFINSEGELVARRIGMLDYELLEYGISLIK